MEPQNIQIAPEVIQAIIAQATARGLSVDEYLRQVHGVINGTPSLDSQALARPFYETATVEEWVRKNLRNGRRVTVPTRPGLLEKM